MKKQDTPLKLWQEIGLEYEPIKVSGFIDESGQAQQHRIDNESEVSQVLSGTSDFIKPCNQSMESEENHTKNFERQQLDSYEAILQQSKKEMNVKGSQVEEYDAIEVEEEYSHIENIIDYSNDLLQGEASKQANSQYQQSQEYHPSATSLCSNNNIRHQKTSLPQQKQRLNILIRSVGELQREVRNFKQFIEHFVKIFSRQQQSLMGQIGGKYQELEKQYSLKMQELIFSKRQQYEQLRYEYDVIKVKEQVTRYPVKSQYFLPEATVSQIQVVQKEAKEQEIEQLKQKIIHLEDQRDALREEVGSFKDKIVGIEANTQSIKDSNDKLYEYIFDLEQQCALHKQEIFLVAKKVRQQVNDNLVNQLHQLEEDKQALISKEELLTEEVGMLKNQLKDVSTQKAIVQEECGAFKQEIRKLKLEIQEVRRQLCAKNEELIKSQSIRGQMYGTTSLQNNLEDESPFSSRGKNSVEMEKYFQIQMFKRGDTQRKDKEWKQYIEQIQLQKALLERQNLRLKAKVQFPNQSSQKKWPFQQSPQTTTYPIENHYLSERYENALPPDTSSDKYLKMKEKELQQYQHYLYSETIKLQEKQKQIETDYPATKVRERSQRRNTYQKDSSQDNYGMKTKTLLNSKTYFPSIQQRSNHFFSSEAQAIIEKVKRSQRNNNSCTSNCDNSCRCEQLSRGSRTSRDSDNRNSYGFQSFKPYTSPSKDYYQRGQKSSKMKLIEEKVKRLKSQLKNSLTTMKQ